MKTIHITSQDELPQVAGAIIGSLGRRTVVAFRGEMGAGKTWGLCGGWKKRALRWSSMNPL